MPSKKKVMSVLILVVLGAVIFISEAIIGLELMMKWLI